MLKVWWICSCCCLSLLPQLACSIHPTWCIEFSRSLYVLERPFAKDCLILERRKCSALLSRKQRLLVTGCSLAADVLMKFDQLPIGCSCPYLCCCWCLGCLRMTSCGVDQDSDFKWQNWHKDIFLQLASVPHAAFPTLRYACIHH